jgi:hypothetical protein
LSFFAYVFHGLLCLLLFLVSALAVVSGAQALRLGMLPWTGSTLEYILLLGSSAGLVSVLLAVKGRWRPLFFVWNLAVVVVLIKGYIFSSYRFIPGEFRTAVFLIVGSSIALLGSFMAMGGRSRS